MSVAVTYQSFLPPPSFPRDRRALYLVGRIACLRFSPQIAAVLTESTKGPSITIGVARARTRALSAVVSGGVSRGRPLPNLTFIQPGSVGITW